MENQLKVSLSFTCNRTWEDMKPVEGGRFCNDCQKKVIDFTDKTPDEIASYLAISTTQVCGRFTASQLVPAPTKTFWKRRLSAAAMFAIFIGIKEASAQTLINNTKTDSLHQEDKGQKDVKDGATPRIGNQSYFIGAVEVLPKFPGGEKAFGAYLNQNLHTPKNTTGRVITSFVVEKDGSLTDVKVLRGLSKEADEEAIRVLKASPKWIPGSQIGKVVRVAYVMPINF